MSGNLRRCFYARPGVDWSSRTLTARLNRILWQRVMRILRHLIVWSLLTATAGGWIASIPRSGDASQTAAAAPPRECAYDSDEPAIPPAPSLVFARPYVGASALSVVTSSHHARPPQPPMRGIVARSAVPRHRRVPLYGLFRVYRI